MSNREQVVLNGRYELHRRVGRGGMAEVYLARDRLLDRLVAIKILFPEFATDPSFVARFRREAQAAANLNHPNIVGVYDWGKERGTYYIVMEYVDGRTISDILRTDGTIEPKKAAGIAADVAAALGFAHRKGVVHRDVKPGNVLITAAGEVKVADFGIARAMTSQGEEDLTQAGSVMGTATYFSPEQAQGQTVDARTDLYSLGVVLYEMASGKPPFTAESPVAIAYKHVQEPVPPLRDKVPDIPPAYEAIVNKALAKNPDDRYPDGAAMRADLLRFREGRSVAAAGSASPGLAGADPADPPTSATMAVPRAGGPVPGAVAAPEATASQPPHKRTGWLFGIILLLVAVLGVLLFAFGRQLGIFENQKKSVAVPTVVGLDVDVATTKLKDAGFKVQPTLRADAAAVGKVLDQDPKDTTAKEGSTVRITVSSGPGTARLEDLAGKTEGEARDALTAAQFSNVQPRYEESADQPPGIVLFTEPGPGIYARDRLITLVVSIPSTSTTTASTTTTTTAPTTTTAAPTTTTTSPPTTTTVPATTTAPSTTPSSTTVAGG
ncbi:MAG: serine/threonine protein kinase with sensor(s) [Acidimicrobiales bacterium]|nr:serine/threonine protein kinase with sensor(s) [Acidimicrobiales bacterium]